jgi:hypothetical protein
LNDQLRQGWTGLLDIEVLNDTPASITAELQA